MGSSLITALEGQNSFHRVVVELQSLSPDFLSIPTTPCGAATNYRLRDAYRQMVRHLEGWQEEPMWGGTKTVQRVLDSALQEVPGVSPFEAAMYWLQVNPKLMGVL